jgi:hypothetical protein
VCCVFLKFLNFFYTDDFNMRSIRTSSASNSSSTNNSREGSSATRAVESLLEFWLTCFASTELVPVTAAAAAAGKPTDPTAAAAAQLCKLPFSAVGFDTLHCIVAAVGTYFHALGSPGREVLSTGAWKTALNILKASLGPVPLCPVAGAGATPGAPAAAPGGEPEVGSFVSTS